MRDIEKEAAADKRAARIGEFVEAWSAGDVLGGLAGGVLKDVRIRMPTEEDPGALVVVKASSDEGSRIAFVGAYNVGDALLAWRAKARAGSLKWREDVPWKQR